MFPNFPNYKISWTEIPAYPTDCFAVVAQLLEQSGAYHHIRTMRPASDEMHIQNALRELLDRLGVDERIQEEFYLGTHSEVVWEKIGKLLRGIGSDHAGDDSTMAMSSQVRDREEWNLRISPDDQREWVKIGRAWALMLPFVPSVFDRLLILNSARAWLKSTASLGHDPLWFDRHALPLDLCQEAERNLDRLNRTAMHKYGRYGSIGIDEIERCFDGIAVHQHRHDGSDVVHKLSEELEVIDRHLLAVDRRTLQAEWDVLMKHGGDRVLMMRSEWGPAMPTWWTSALKLLIAADEACIRLGTLSGEYFDALRLGATRARARAYREDIINEHAKEKPSFPRFPNDTNGNKWRVASRISVLADIECLFGKPECPPDWPKEGQPPTDRQKRWYRLAKAWLRSFQIHSDEWTDAGNRRRDYLDAIRDITFTFSGLVDHDYACVFPKSRMPSSGNTLRNLTNNLALLPARGIARANLRRGEERAFRRNNELNLLLVPFPFHISASSFRDAGPANSHGSETKWRWFDLRQDWLSNLKSDHLTSAIDLLCKAAETEVEQIDAVVFPEAALNYPLYAALALHISREHPSIELLISGVSQRPDRRKIKRYGLTETENAGVGDLARPFSESEIRLSALNRGLGARLLKSGNFVGTTTFLRYGDEDVSTYLMTFQDKHHRWCLEAKQITRYGIWKQLDPQFDWWENIETSTRNIELTTFRGSSTVAALICEDLARIEPCQELIRAIGPNLVVALLLDGPQRTDRWSARYATVLADDPGSSVLCLTSMGLMARSTKDRGAGARCIGLWKDDSGETQEIHLSRGAHAVVLRLEGVRKREVTIDGRDDADLAISWRFRGCIPIHDSSLRQELAREFVGKL